ncbi:prp40, partial [Symbiodinium sp. KB8]
DPDFLAIEDSQERRDLFKEYVSDLARANEEREKRERQKKIDAFIELLKESDFVTVESRWSEVKVRLEEDPRYQDLDKKERLLAFKEYILGLEREEAEEKRKAVEAEKEKLREEFEQVMADGEVANAKIREKFKELVEIIGDSKPWPMHLFNDYVGALYRDFNTDRRAIDDLLAGIGFKITESTTAEQYLDALASKCDTAKLEELEEERRLREGKPAHPGSGQSATADAATAPEAKDADMDSSGGGADADQAVSTPAAGSS